MPAPISVWAGGPDRSPLRSEREPELQVDQPIDGDGRRRSLKTIQATYLGEVPAEAANRRRQSTNDGIDRRSSHGEMGLLNPAKAASSSHQYLRPLFLRHSHLSYRLEDLV